MNAVINVENLNVSYGEISIIHNFNLSIPYNSFLAIVGHNGCGKSTLLKTISGLQKVSSGVVEILDKNIKLYDNVYKSGILSFLSQNQQIGFDVKVSELLLMGRHRFSKLFSNYTKEDFKQVDSVVSDLDLSLFFDRNFLDLSGGEQQIVLFAQVILQDAEIIILDEPTQNLDIKNGYKITSYLNKLVKEKKKTVIISTHDLHHLSEVEGYILNMSANSEYEKINSSSIDEKMKSLRI